MRSPSSIIWRTVVWSGAMLALPGCPGPGRPVCTQVQPMNMADPRPVEPAAGDPDDQLTTVLVDSNPSGAQIYVGDEGQVRGVTPMVLELERNLGEVKVRLVADGYQPAEVTVPLDTDQTVAVGMKETEETARARCESAGHHGRGFVLS